MFFLQCDIDVKRWVCVPSFRTWVDLGYCLDEWNVAEEMLHDFEDWVIKAASFSVSFPLSTCPWYSATILWGSPTSPCRGTTWKANIAHQTCEWVNLHMVPAPSFWVFQLRHQISWSKDKLFSLCLLRIQKPSEVINDYSCFMPLNFVAIC